MTLDDAAIETSTTNEQKTDEHHNKSDLKSGQKASTPKGTESTSTATPDSTVDGEVNKSAKTCLQLKGSMFTLTVLDLYRYRYREFTKELENVVKQAPNFFNQTPVIINLDKLEDPNEAIDFIDLVQLCQEYGLHPVAIKGGHEDQQINALVAGLPKIPTSGNKSNEDRSPNSPKVAELSELVDDNEADYTTKIIQHPVRSGQQIYAAGGDLIVLSSVSAGAEILADGNIHVYGALRGRALAGVKGNHSARIFCQRLEAELISIAGHYKISEDLRGSHWQQGVQASLYGKQLTIKAI